MDTQSRIEEIRNTLLECLTFGELTSCCARFGALVDASQTLVYQCLSSTALAFHGGTLAPFMPGYAAYYPDDPVHPYMRSIANSFVLLQTDCWKLLEGSAAYPEFYQPHDVHHLLGVRPTPFQYGQAGMFGFLFTRSRRQGNFQTHHASALAALEPDVRAAWRRSQRTFALRRDAALLSEVAVNKLQNEVVALLDGLGRLVWITPGAEQLWSKQSSAALKHVLSAAARDSLSTSGRSYPLPQRGELAGVPVICDLALWHGMPEQPCYRVRMSVDVPRRIATERGLTPAQARALEHLAAGRSNRAIATALKVSEHTVRSHMAQIRERTGLRSRAEVLALYAEKRSFDLSSR